MRQIVIDTETTGLEPEKGHRIIEIGCVEMVDRQLTGNKFHKYLNPGREVEIDALAIHGITNEFLQDKPTFADILPEFLEFIRGAELVAHNADFDVSFINYEMEMVAKNTKLLDDYVSVFDTLVLARKKFPGQRNTLDAICKRYKIDLSERKLHGHGALLDAQLLAEAYLQMTGGQGNLFSDQDLSSVDMLSYKASFKTDITINKPSNLIITYANSIELTAHEALLEKIKKASKRCLWKQE